MAFEYDQFNPEKVRYPVAEVNGVDIRTLSGDITLSERDGRMHVLNNGGAARNVTFFAVTGENKGRIDCVYNSGGGVFNLVVKDSAGSTLATLAQNTSAWFASNAAGTLHIRIA
jgi:hypothetical protein